MFIDPDQKIEMRFEDESAGSNGDLFLVEQFVNRLRHHGVKAAISPELVLKTAVPSLKLPHQLSFNYGDTQFDDMNILHSYQELFQLRPFVKLHVQGGYDPSADREVLQGRLQKLEDEKREIENKRRALEKVRILQEEQRRRKELKSTGKEGVVEEVIPGYSKKDLEPLPPVKVVLPESQLVGLAKERGRIIYDYLVNQLRLDPSRVILDDTISKSGAVVNLQVLPFKPPGLTQ